MGPFKGDSSKFVDRTKPLGTPGGFGGSAQCTKARERTGSPWP